MRSLTAITFLCATLATSAVLCAQEIPAFNVDGRSVQVHAFASEGFAESNANNYLTMDTTKGSGDFADFGVNIGTNITDKFHVGAQIYDYNVGTLGGWHPTLDWAFGDYKFKDWFGVRAGKVKTALGLFNDTQDMGFLQTWALLPQSIYPLDLRASTISHVGGDVYGHFGLRKAGSLDYTAYVGTRPDDQYGGYYKNSATLGTPLSSFGAKVAGGDLRWTTPVTGLTVGTSLMDIWWTVKGKIVLADDAPLLVETTDPQRIFAGYADYAIGNWHLDAEYRANKELYSVHELGTIAPGNGGDKEFFASIAYRVNKHLELGTYNSRFYVNVPTSPEAAASHIFDQAVTARFDLTKFWNVKAEYHFIDGYGSIYSSHGFYLQDNATGLKPKTDLLVIRTGFNF
jgi:hypothetical protein